jgi:hypothetical protein
MQQTISVKTQTGSDYDLGEINQLQSEGWNVVQVATPVGCTATLVVLEKNEVKSDKPE